ncbi:DUF1501 domain-containing protein [Gimesia sp.]|uniref:DUF1501 domain-containing protein n=1 Tax=Gimesia sp. TaxID=2024833 RepID=UPI000C4B5837|nr:DUF1501 domain-containing protein [Gimesia sp.]MAX37435.1 sulfatase [Gimesia sp.]HBL46108.1 DUF1501 domain-containing protein [Planctomycetaceae bacterium]
MNHWNTNLGPARISRRDMLRQSSAGFGSLALAALLGGKSQAGQTPFEPQPHFTPKAKRVIFLFMHGGPSHMDTFDYKPQLQKDSGKPLPFDKPKIFSAQTGNLLGSPWKFQRHGESGAWVSELFPHVAGCVDDLCIINSMYGSNSRHGGALLELHTGSDTFVRPSMGSWITYGLGSENQDLPGFITVCPTLTHGGVNAYSSSFLPADFQGTPIGNASIPADRALIPFISNKSGVPYSIQRKELDFLQQMNREHLTDSGPDADLEGRINSFELAYRMQMAAPELQDISDESEATQKMYGLDQDITKNFGRQCLMARRFAERGVRFVQITHSYKWDQHSGLKSALPRNCMEVDQPIAALIKDLKSRGLLEDTLVLWGGEFGRTPVSQGENGRDHNPQGYTMWMAGGGIKAGLQYGATDDYGYYAVKNKIHVHDLHATMLHLLGLDHQKLTYKFAGRDFRLTDVHGEVMYDLFA